MLLRFDMGTTDGRCGRAGPGLSPLAFEPARFGEDPLGWYEEGGVELPWVELNVEEDFVVCTVPLLESFEESDVWKLALDFLRRSLKKGMIVRCSNRLVSCINVLVALEELVWDGGLRTVIQQGQAQVRYQSNDGWSDDMWAEFYVTDELFELQVGAGLNEWGMSLMLLAQIIALLLEEEERQWGWAGQSRDARKDPSWCEGRRQDWVRARISWIDQWATGAVAHALSGSFRWRWACLQVDDAGGACYSNTTSTSRYLR